MLFRSIWYDTDREVLENAFPTIGLPEPPEARVIQISNTLHLAEVLVSAAYRPEVEQRSDLEIVGLPSDLAFDASGNLFPVAAH